MHFLRYFAIALMAAALVAGVSASDLKDAIVHGTTSDDRFLGFVGR
jgi:hypothetical protein